MAFHGNLGTAAAEMLGTDGCDDAGKARLVSVPGELAMPALGRGAITR